MRKSFLKVQIKIYLILTLCYLAVAVLSGLLLWWLTPLNYYSGAFPLIDVFYFLCGIAMNYFLNRTYYRNPDKLLNVYMFFRFGQFILTLVFLVVGLMVFNYPRLPFVIALLANYFIYTALEVYIYYRYNKRITTGKWR